MDNENLGEFLSGDRIENSPYRIEMKKDMFCEQVCISHLGRVEAKGVSPSKVVRAIRKEYHNNWIVDNLPSASKMEDDKKSYTKYFHGFPVGFIASDDKKAYVITTSILSLNTTRLMVKNLELRSIELFVSPLSLSVSLTIIAPSLRTMTILRTLARPRLPTRKKQPSRILSHPVITRRRIESIPTTTW